MLLLSREPRQTITIGDDITIVVKRINGQRVQLAIQAPPELRILRGELDERDERSEAA